MEGGGGWGLTDKGGLLQNLTAKGGFIGEEEHNRAFLVVTLNSLQGLLTACEL